MGKRGPLPKPKTLREAQGNPGHAKKSAVAATTSAPVVVMEPSDALAPSWLSREERALWDKITPELSRLRLLAMPDAAAFGRYVQWLKRYLDLNKATTGKVVRTTRSMQRIDKGFVALATIDRQLLMYEDRFGMNPRERLAIMDRLSRGSIAPPARPVMPTAADAVKPADQDAPKMPAPAAVQKSPVGFLRAKSLN